MAHTPGPWSMRHPEVSTLGKFLQVVSDSYRRECNADHVVCELRLWKRPSPIADATLIAAAPDLLAALKLLRDPDGDGQWRCDCHDPYFEGTVCENCVATAAINKAEGRVE